MANVVEIAISFDTTGSMAECLHTVRDNLDQNIKRILVQHPDTRIAIIAHGDYEDAYVTKEIDFTSDMKELRLFVTSVERTTGVGPVGDDADECYELVMRRVRTKLSWTPGSKRAYVLIGDCGPHPPGFPLNVNRIDWREEIRGLAKMGIRGYAVHVDGLPCSKHMYETLATQTGGVYLKLSDLANISDLLVAICKHQQGPAHLQEYENELRARPGDVHPNMEAILNSLRQQLNLQ